MSIVNYYQDIESIFSDLEKQSVIIIDGKNWKELINVVYTIPYEKELLDILTVPDTNDDLTERTYLLDRLQNDCIDILKADKNSRRAVFANLYLPDKKMCKCISLVQFFIRNEKLFMNMYIRSQNFEKNFVYDCQTATFLMEKAIAALNVLPGEATIFCANLHKRIK